MLPLAGTCFEAAKQVADVAARAAHDLRYFFLGQLIDVVVDRDLRLLVGQAGEELADQGLFLAGRAAAVRAQPGDVGGDELGAVALVAQAVQAGVGRHAVEPGGHRAAPLELIGSLDERGEYILQHVAGLGFVADDLAGASLALRGIPGGDFPAGPGYIACEPANVDVVGGAPLVLDPAVVGVPLPHASATRIAQIHPNPFNPRVSIRFELQGSGPVQLEVYDLAGRLVKVLAVRQGAAGSQVVQWDGRDAQGREAASGVYMICLQEGGVVDVRRAALLR